MRTRVQRGTFGFCCLPKVGIYKNQLVFYKWARERLQNLSLFSNNLCGKRLGIVQTSTLHAVLGYPHYLDDSFYESDTKPDVILCFIVLWSIDFNFKNIQWKSSNLIWPHFESNKRHKKISWNHVQFIKDGIGNINIWILQMKSSSISKNNYH